MHSFNTNGVTVATRAATMERRARRRRAPEVCVLVINLRATERVCSRARFRTHPHASAWRGAPAEATRARRARLERQAAHARSSGPWRDGRSAAWTALLLLVTAGRDAGQRKNRSYSPASFSALVLRGHVVPCACRCNASRSKPVRHTRIGAATTCAHIISNAIVSPLWQPRRNPP